MENENLNTEETANSDLGAVMRSFTIYDLRKAFEAGRKEDPTEYWVDLVNWESGGIEEVSNNNLLEFKKDIDVEIQRRLKK